MADPHFNAEDKARILEGVDQILDGMLSMGPNVRAFEEEFAAMVGTRHAIAMNACTSTLEAALQYYNVAGREVIVPAETFIATGMAVHLSGGIPVFAEVGDSLCLDLADVEARVTERTAGVIVVHMAGNIAPEIQAFREMCDARGIFLIEDAAHSPGARIGDRQAGSFGHAGCFSFFSTKVLAAGEGGMLTTDDDAIATFARSFQHRGRDMTAKTEQYLMPGRNVRMTEMAALVGRTQLARLHEYLDRRRMVAAVYARDLAGQNGIRLVMPASLENSSFWKVPLLLDPEIDRVAVTEYMMGQGVAVDWAYQPALHLQPVFRAIGGYSEGTLPRTEALLSRHLCLPCHPRISEDDAIYVAQTLVEAVRTAARTSA
ncbi:DegT/DnrJ/EryC1/StrS aminotransferase family protein [Sphingomonas sp. R-74633]|uniref:DegT/DnrJ/EryC1/StrS family aminotransferase n=1 Tax=Sphingomonas sp. R-74633 TaxID=2751188 RepID=UPI0015D2126A|nr:DegT/DnrJ/EryC1/StrS family aminotransferase [Sphingomonas sp. R-74633]